jgi:hypothetical protein
MMMTGWHKYKVSGDVNKFVEPASIAIVNAVMIAAISAANSKYIYGRKKSFKDVLYEDLPVAFLQTPFFGEILAWTYLKVSAGFRGKPQPQTEPMNLIIMAPIEYSAKAVGYAAKMFRERLSGEMNKETGQYKWKETSWNVADNLIQAIEAFTGTPAYPYRAAKGIIKQAVAEPERIKPIEKQ